MYGSYNRGYKSGGFFGGQTVEPADLTPYDDENVDAFEVGAKLQSPQRRMRARLSAFYYDYQDLQVYTLILRGAITVQNFTNASNARIYGAEGEFAFTPVDASTCRSPARGSTRPTRTSSLPARTTRAIACRTRRAPALPRPAL